MYRLVLYSRSIGYELLSRVRLVDLSKLHSHLPSPDNPQLGLLAETLERAKPDPLAYQVGLERLGSVANCAIAFEDSPSGIQSAVGAGILTIGIASTQLPEELYAVGATLVVADFRDRELYGFLNCALHQPSGARR
ncbi:MAG: hypothetical protein DCF22_23805 [Leptolyngbya sp.]|nr:MAG: hypothetical protein DCF22_23805 [Leptolyngbya sp.]